MHTGLSWQQQLESANQFRLPGSPYVLYRAVCASVRLLDATSKASSKGQGSEAVEESTLSCGKTFNQRLIKLGLEQGELDWWAGVVQHISSATVTKQTED